MKHIIQGGGLDLWCGIRDQPSALCLSTTPRRRMGEWRWNSTLS